MLVDYINKYGMDQDMGLFSTSVLLEGYDRELVSKCRNQMNILYEETRKLLEANSDFLEQITAQLLEKESLNGDDIDRICATSPCC